MGNPIRRTATSAGLVLAATLAACSSSGNPGNSPAPSGPAGSPGADSATTKSITEVYKVFFDTDTALGKSVTVLQHGATFRSTLTDESNSPSAVDITAKVSAVKLLNKNLARVTFTIYSGKTTLLPDTHGYAVREDGDWKVAAQTFCSLLNLEGTAPPACKDKSITSLRG